MYWQAVAFMRVLNTLTAALIILSFFLMTLSNQ